MNRLPAAKRRLGQHFLVDQNLLGVIERLAGLGPDDVVLEIGPGAGVLTRFLAERVSFVQAVELDRTLEARLDDALRGLENVRVTYGDAVRLDLAALDPEPTKLVANLPYSVATPIVVESLDGLPRVSSWCVMVQLEVARRFFAAPGAGDYGAVSVLMRLATRRTGFHPVSRTVFRPQPNVDSALVAFERIERPDGWPELKRLVEASFAHRRKTLPNSLMLAGLTSRERAAEALASLDLDPSTRAERLTPPEFVRLRDVLDAHS